MVEITNIKQKIIIALTIICITITSGLACWYTYQQATLIPYYKEYLKKTVDNRVNQINDFLDLQKKNTLALAYNPDIISFMNSLTTHTTAPEIKSKCTALISAEKERMGFKELFLINTTGTILFSTNAHVGEITITDEKYRHTPLFQSFQRSSMTLSYDFSDFLYSIILKQPTLYITNPIFIDHKLIGVIAYNIDEQKIYDITKQYIGLGKTGETVLALQTGPHALFIAPTRHDPHIAFKRRDLFDTKEVIDIQRASLGEYDTGVTRDYRNKQVISAWDFILQVDWGIVVKIDLQEALAPVETTSKLLILFLIISLLLLLLLEIIYSFRVTHALIHFYNSSFVHRLPTFLKRPLPLLTFLFCLLTIKSIYNFYQQTKSSIQDNIDSVEHNSKHGVHEIGSELKKASAVADFIAEDFQTKRLDTADIPIRIKRDVVETDGLQRITIAFAPYAYNSTTKLYAPSVIRIDNKLQEENIADQYDYTNTQENLEHAAWYTHTLESGAQWFDPHQDSTTKTMVITYAAPFSLSLHDTKPIGVVAVTFDLNKIIAAISHISLGQTGYSFILSQDGTFIYHPVKQIMNNKTTLTKLAQERGNEELAIIAQEIQNKKQILQHFENETTNHQEWIYTHPINANKWIIGTIFSENEIGLDMHVKRQLIFWIIAYTAIFILLSIATLFSMITITIIRSPILMFSNAVFIFGLFAVWHTIQITQDFTTPTTTIITDQASLDKFIDDRIEESDRRHEVAPIVVPCGIFLYSIEQKDPNHVILSGYIWHKYHTTIHQGIERSVRIPQATFFRVTGKHTIKNGDWDTEGWKFNATLYQEQDYSHYPLDSNNIIIPLESADLTHNVILAPDLAGYDTINPEATPGIEESFSRTHFWVTQSFFNFIAVDPKVNFGVEEYENITDHYQLTYNAILYNDLISPFILFILPLLVILISIFSTLIVEERKTDPYTMLGPYTGLFFALVLLHRSLRETAPAAGTLYLEYSFFFTYIIIMLLVIHTILAHYYADWDFYQNKLIPLFKNLFWPVQLFLWFFTTLILFY